MGEFVRILKISRTVTVSLQLLQTISIMIQNLKSEHAICKFFLEEHDKLCSCYSFSSWVIIFLMDLVVLPIINLLLFSFCRLHVQ